MAIVADEKMTEEEVKTETSDLYVLLSYEYSFDIILNIILVESEMS